MNVKGRFFRWDEVEMALWSIMDDGTIEVRYRDGQYTAYSSGNDTELDMGQIDARLAQYIGLDTSDLPDCQDRYAGYASEFGLILVEQEKDGKFWVPVEDGHTVIEVCPNCESEIEMRWDVEQDGFKAFCPVCGKRLMLCDECSHGPFAGDCDYSSRTDTCRFNPGDNKTEVVVVVEEGMVCEVYSTDEDVIVEVMDMDTDCAERAVEAEENRKELNRRIDAGELHDVF